MTNKKNSKDFSVKQSKAQAFNADAQNLMVGKAVSSRNSSETEREAKIVVMNPVDNVLPAPNESMENIRAKVISAVLGDRSDMVSIVVQVYNRLDKAKTCVECILKYTQNIDYELILLDNGSTENVLDFFKSVPYEHKKIVRVTKNIGGLAIAPQLEWEGRYFAFVTGDTYVTQNWLSNLLTCLKSDPSIGMVTPVIFNEDHNEKAKFTFNSFDEMQEKAARHNVSDPRLWHERILIEPVVGVYKREAFDIAGKILDYGFSHAFSDYDTGFRFRRAGYKTMLCKDTFVHHDHIRSAEPKAVESRNRELAAAKEDFQRKYFGLDGWADAANYEFEMLSLVDPAKYKADGQVDILGIDVRCGAPILEIKNRLREGGIFNTRLSAFTTDPKYWLDLKTICAGDVIVDRKEFFDAHFSTCQFDVIQLGRPINSYSQESDLLQQTLKRLKPDGHLLLKLRNTFDVVAAFKSLGAIFPVDVSDDFPAHQINVDDFYKEVKNIGFEIKKITVENWPHDASITASMEKIISSAGFTEDKAKVLTRAFVRNYVMDIAR